MMLTRRITAGLLGGALIASAIALAPAIGASVGSSLAPRRLQTPITARGIGSFTPAAGDQRLAASLARAGLIGTGFRFTPVEARKNGSRPITVAVRARSTSTRAETARLAVAAPTVGLTPIAYSLGVGVGWKRFALSGDMAKVDLAGLPGGRETAEVGISYTGRKLSGRLQAGAERPIATTAPLAADPETYSLDLGGSYSISPRIDLTAGVRYRSDRERLARVNDDRRDSQAVYVGTAFRF